jgi:hypothetical protein
MADWSGRRLMWGWIAEGRSVEAQKAAGWAGVMSLPRLLSLRPEGTLAVEPAPELRVLRGEVSQWSQMDLEPGEPLMLDPQAGDCLEILAAIEVRDAARVGLLLRRSPNGEEETRLYLDCEQQQLLFDRTTYILTRTAGVAAHIRPTKGLLQSIIHKKHAPESLLNPGRQPWLYPDSPMRISCASVMDLFEKSADMTVEGICMYGEMLERGRILPVAYPSNFVDGRVAQTVDCGLFARHAVNRYASDNGVSAS